MTSKHSIKKVLQNGWRAIVRYGGISRIENFIPVYFHVSVDVVETTVASEYTESRVPETTLGVVPKLTTARAIEGNSCLTHGLMDKMTATSQKTILNAFPSMKVLFCDSNFTEVWSMAWRLFCKGNTLVTDEFPSHRASSAETFGILLHRHNLTRGKIAGTSSQMKNFHHPTWY